MLWYLDQGPKQLKHKESDACEEYHRMNERRVGVYPADLRVEAGVHLIAS